jgi:hypothetical protein
VKLQPSNWDRLNRTFEQIDMSLRPGARSRRHRSPRVMIFARRSTVMIFARRST